MATIRCRSVRLKPRAALDGLAGTAVLVIWFAVFLQDHITWRSVVLLVEVVAAIAAAMSWRERAVRNGELELDDGAIRIQRAGRRSISGGRVVKASDVDDGHAPAPSHVLLWLRGGGSIDLELEEDRAGEVLVALRIALDRRVLSAPLTGAFDAEAWAAAALVAVASLGYWIDSSLVGLLLSVALGGICAIAVSRRLRPRVLIGLDGVRIVGAVRRRFVPYASVASVAREGRARQHVVLETSSGAVRLSCIASGEEQLRSMVERIEEGRVAAALTHAPPLELLDRRSAPVERWQARLRDMVLGTNGFRGPGLAEADLEQVLADPKAPLERRVGAGLALRNFGHEACARIRVAAATSANARARAALDAAGADEIDDEAITRTLRHAVGHEPDPAMFGARPGRYSRG